MKKYTGTVSLPVKHFVACSEDEDVEDLGPTDFAHAKAVLELLRSEHPDQAWELVAVVDA